MGPRPNLPICSKRSQVCVLSCLFLAFSVLYFTIWHKVLLYFLICPQTKHLDGGCYKCTYKYFV